MSATHDLMASLAERGLRVELRGAEVVCRGPRAALTPDLLAKLRTRKPELVALLSERAGLGLVDVLFELERLGVRIASPDGAGLRVASAESLPPELAAGLERHRVGILALVLRAQAAGLPWPLDALTPEDNLVPEGWEPPSLRGAS